MDEPYTASVYSNEKQIVEKKGSDIDALYTWMLIQGNSNIGDIRGEIIENNTGKIIKTFRKCAIE